MWIFRSSSSSHRHKAVTVILYRTHPIVLIPFIINNISTCAVNDNVYALLSPCSTKRCMIAVITNGQTNLISLINNGLEHPLTHNRVIVKFKNRGICHCMFNIQRTLCFCFSCLVIGKNTIKCAIYIFCTKYHSLTNFFT